MSQIYSSDTQIDNPVTVAGGTIDASGSAVSVTNFPAVQPVSGAVSVSNFPATQPVSGTVSIAGTVNVLTAVSSSATVAQVSQGSNVDTVLLASNANRKSAIIFLPKSGTGVKYGTGASTTSFTYKTGASNTTIIVTGYTGAINSFGPSDTINITELV